MSREKVRALYFALKWFLLGMFVPTVALDVVVLFLRTQKAFDAVNVFVLVLNLATILPLILRGSMSTYFSMKVGERTAYNVVDLLANLSRDAFMLGGVGLLMFMTDGFNKNYTWFDFMNIVLGLSVFELLEHVVPLFLWKRLDRSWGFPEDPLFLQPDSSQAEKVAAT